MEQLTILSDNTPLGNEALQLHFEIKLSLATAASAITEFARQLKQMRDKKLYEHIGFENFEEYVEKAHGIKQRQAYTYIQTYEKLSPRLMENNAQLGITKLSLLCQISAVDREDFAQENDLDGLTVDEVKKLIEEKNGLHEQVSLLQDKSDSTADTLILYNRQIEALKNELAEKVETIEELSVQQEPIDTAAIEQEKIDAAVQDALKNAEKENKAAIAEALKKERIAQDKILIKKLAEEKNKAAKETEGKLAQELKKQSGELTKEVAAAREQAERLEKQLALAGNQNTVKFSILFKQVQNDILACLEVVEAVAVEDTQQANKLKQALKTVTSQMLEG